MENNIITLLFKSPIEIIKDFIGFLFVIYSLSSADMQCHKDSPSYKYAHSLSQQRLEQIYTDFRKYASEGNEIKRITKRSKNRPIEFEDLQYKRLILSKRDIANGVATVRLNFCMDESIDLEIEGLLSDNPIIKLAWGELERTDEILWQKNN